jgi:hypothetical protein
LRARSPSPFSNLPYTLPDEKISLSLQGAGVTVTLLCSSACVDEEQCHRTLLKELIERAVSR